MLIHCCILLDVLCEPSINHVIHCTDFPKSQICLIASAEDHLYPIIPRSVKKMWKERYKFIDARKYNLAVTAPSFQDTHAYPVTFLIQQTV
jgi:hypothetical protein